MKKICLGVYRYNRWKKRIEEFFTEVMSLKISKRNKTKGEEMPKVKCPFQTKGKRNYSLLQRM
jgi:hypothetical protein